MPLHVGDLGWAWRLGADAVAAAVRTWHRDDAVVVVGFLDGPVLRLAADPAHDRDADLAAAALRSAGASPAWVAAPAADTAGVAAYASAGSTRPPDVRDLPRPDVIMGLSPDDAPTSGGSPATTP